MNRVALDLGIVQIYWYSLCILVGMMIGMFFVYRETRKKNINDVVVTNLILSTVIVSIIGARLYYVIFDWKSYSENPIEIFEIWNGGLAIHGAIILGGLYLISYTRRHKLDTLKILDICSVGLIIGQAMGRWGNFFNQEVYGTEVSIEFLKGLHLPGFIIDGMHIGGVYHHPLFLYESLWCILGFIVLLLIRKRKYIKTGQIFGIYCMWYSLARFFLEGMRESKYNLMLGNFKAAQIVSIGMFVVGLFFFIRRIKTSRFEHLYNDEEIHIDSTIKQNERLSKKVKTSADFAKTAEQLNNNISTAPTEAPQDFFSSAPVPTPIENKEVQQSIPEPATSVSSNEVQTNTSNPFLTTSNNEQPVINVEMQNQVISNAAPVQKIENVQSQVQEQSNFAVNEINLNSMPTNQNIQNQQIPVPEINNQNNINSQIPESVLGNQIPGQIEPTPNTGKKNKFIN